jgi:RNA-directed DNA polymerase
MIAGWLKAGVIEDGIFTPTEEGTPQGGVISPLMMNVALHGLEEAAGVRYQTSGRRAGYCATLILHMVATLVVRMVRA